MLPFLLIFNFVLLLGFGGYTSGWELFDFWWSGGAMICGAFLLLQRPIRFHMLGLYLMPALLVLAFPRVWNTQVISNLGWWGITLFLAFLLPTRIESDSISKALLETIRWCGAGLTALYVVQDGLVLPVHGFGFSRSSEAQILLGAMACCLMREWKSDRLGQLWKYLWLLFLVAGIFLNGSRSAMLGAGIVLIGFVWLRRQASWKAYVVGLATVSLCTVIAVTLLRTKIDPHSELRSQIFVLACQIFAEHPLGSGAGTFITESLARSFPIDDPRFLSQFAKVINHAHNVFLHWAAEGGIPGMATALAIVLSSCALLFHKLRLGGSGWPIKAASVWCPAFVLELMINVSEGLSLIRWMALVGILALTAEYSMIVLKKPRPLFRLMLILLGAFYMYVGISDLFARQAIRIGIKLEEQGVFVEALESYQEAHSLRPWDEQPLLHMAQVSILLGRLDLVESYIEKALQVNEGQGAVRYYGAAMYRKVDRHGSPPEGVDSFIQKSRYLMFSLNEMHPYDVPIFLDGVDWSRSDWEKIWRLRRVLSLEPRAARAYDELARLASSAGDQRHSAMFSSFARQVRHLYQPGILRGLSEFSILNRNVAPYESRLLSGYDRQTGFERNGYMAGGH